MLWAGTTAMCAQAALARTLRCRLSYRSRLEEHRMKRAAFGLLLAFAAGPALAQAEWPARPIRLIVPFTAGSSSDIVARIVAQKLGERLKQQVFVENRVGASGSLGSE